MGLLFHRTISVRYRSTAEKQFFLGINFNVALMGSKSCVDGLYLYLTYMLYHIAIYITRATLYTTYLYSMVLLFYALDNSHTCILAVHCVCTT